MKDRREFLKRMAMVSAMPVFHGNAFAAQRDIDRAKERFDPGMKLVRDGLEFAKKNKAANVPPVLREEILDNPNAVFLVRTSVASTKEGDGKFPAENEQFEREGNRLVNLIFRKGAGRGGTTYIKPNFVGGFNADPRSVNNGVSAHPSFVAGFSDALKDIGNTNVVVGANGGANHENFVQSGLSGILHDHGIFFTEGKYDSWKDYTKDEIVWVDYPEGIVMKQVPFFRLTKEKDTTFINLAKDRIHQLGFTTLTIKNLQGIMPVGYMHICRPWAGNLDDARILEPKRKVFADFQRPIEKLYIRHARMNFKYWDEGGHSSEYFRNGGWEAFQRGEFEPDYETFWGEQWGQRMMDINNSITPYINLVEGIVGIDGKNVLHLNNFVTVSRNRVSCDSLASWLMGHDPRELPYLRIASERGLGDNDIEKMQIYMLSEKGVERVGDYRTLPRAKMGVWVYRTEGAPLRYF